MKKNWLVTLGGIMSGCAILPPAMGQANMHAPNWLNLAFFCIAGIGGIIMGVAAKGQDEHSTSQQVAASDAKTPATPAQPPQP